VKPISDDKFDLIRNSHFSYDRNIPFDAEVRTYDGISDDYKKEMVTINAAYDGERMGINIFTPKNNNISPPYQAVITFPGLSSIHERSSEKRKPDMYIIESGRAVIMPNYKGMFERDPLPNNEITSFDEAPISEWVKDWLRTIDYLETREDIDANRLAYLGGSVGGCIGTFISGSKEPRFKACILVLGGIPYWEIPRPEHDPINYIPRIKIPVLMISGRHDPLFPLEISVKPMFELLGTPEEDKYHIVVLEGQHGGWDGQKTDIEALKFLDKYLGKPLRK
jgi:dienelactone hydrolase